MATTQHTGFPHTAVSFGRSYVRTAVKYTIYFTVFSLVAAQIFLQTIPALIALLPVSILSYSLHIAAYRFRDTDHDDRASLTDVFGDDSLTDFAALVIGLYAAFTSIYAISVVAGMFVVGLTDSIYLGVLVAAYVPVLDVAGNQLRWYLSIQALVMVAYVHIVHSIDILTRLTRDSLGRFFPGYRFEPH